MKGKAFERGYKGVNCSYLACVSKINDPYALSHNESLTLPLPKTHKVSSGILNTESFNVNSSYRKLVFCVFGDDVTTSINPRDNKLYLPQTSRVDL